MYGLILENRAAQVYFTAIIMSAPEKAKFYHAEPKKRPNEEVGTLAITFIIVYSTIFFYKTLGNCVEITSSNF